MNKEILKTHISYKDKVVNMKYVIKIKFVEKLCSTLNPVIGKIRFITTIKDRDVEWLFYSMKTYMNAKEKLLNIIPDIES